MTVQNDFNYQDQRPAEVAPGKFPEGGDGGYHDYADRNLLSSENLSDSLALEVLPLVWILGNDASAGKPGQK